MSYHPDALLPEDGEVLLYCMAKGSVVPVLARRTWAVERDDGHTITRVLVWESTWDGSRIPLDWKPYAYETLVEPDAALAP